MTEVLEEETKTYEDKFNDLWTNLVREDLKGSAGMPIGVSVVALPFEDEIALGVMKAIEKGCNFLKSPNL